MRPSRNANIVEVQRDPIGIETLNASAADRHAETSPVGVAREHRGLDQRRVPDRVRNLQAFRRRTTAIDLHRYELRCPFRIADDPLREFARDADDAVAQRRVSGMAFRIDFRISCSAG
jgi:hypothetical protein